MCIIFVNNHDTDVVMVTNCSLSQLWLPTDYVNTVSTHTNVSACRFVHLTCIMIGINCASITTSFLINIWITHHELCTSLIARFIGPTWGPSGADRTQVGPMLAPLTLLSGMVCVALCWFDHIINFTPILPELFSSHCGTHNVVPVSMHWAFRIWVDKTNESTDHRLYNQGTTKYNKIVCIFCGI